MPPTKTTSPSPPPAAKKPALDEQTYAFLLKEYDALNESVTHAEQSAQSIFNFYLTLVTTVVGGIVLITQVSGTLPADLTQAQWIISGLLVFAAGIGSMYLSSLSGRYAHLARFGQALDELRLFLIQKLDAPTPPAYRDFIKPRPAVQSWWRWIYWLTPTGTYQLFVASVNSLSLAGALWFFLAAGQVAQQDLPRSLVAVGLIFVLAFLANNIYSHTVIRLLIGQLNVRFDTRRGLDWIAGKQ